MKTIKWLIFASILAIGLAIGAIVFYAYQPFSFSKLPYEFSLKQGSSLKSAARQMKQAGVLSNDTAFVLLARLMGKASQIKPGNYQLDKPLTPLQLLDVISKGRVEQSEVVIIEGWSFRQLRAALNEKETLRHDTINLSPIISPAAVATLPC